MKKITMFMFDSCPYCRKARSIQDQLLQEKKYAGLEIEMIDEKIHPDVADRYDYYFVPTYYYEGKKLHEGAAGETELRSIFDAVVAL